MDRAFQARRFAIVNVMKNWVGIAQAHGLNLPAHELDRIAQPLGALEETFRPLMKQLSPDMEPDLQLHIDGEGE
jgi:hypothetical protein